MTPGASPVVKALEQSHVLEVLRSARGSLHGDEILPGSDRDDDIIELYLVRSAAQVTEAGARQAA
ncbi:MAG: hypothetical protein ACR2LV_06125 [Solirubrobacteraceae bacterium]